MDEKHSNKTEGSLIDQASIKIWYDFVKEQAEKRKKAAHCLLLCLPEVL